MSFAKKSLSKFALFFLFFIFLSILMPGTLADLQDIKIVFLIDATQNDITGDIDEVQKHLKESYPEANIKDFIVIVENGEKGYENAKEAFCKILQIEGAVAVIDFTYFPWLNSQDIVRPFSIPYMRVERIMLPFLKIFEEFIKEKNADNVALIFQNDQDTQEAVYEVVNGFRFRSILFDANESSNSFLIRLKRLRPLPSYYAVFATSPNMNIIYDKLSQAKLFERPQEWHFIFLDPNDHIFKYDRDIEFATKFILNSTELCRSMGLVNDKYCGWTFSFRRAILREVLRNLIDLSELKRLTSRQYKNCNNDKSSIENDQEDNFSFSKEFKFNDFITYSTGMGNEFIPILTYRVNVSINLLNNKYQNSLQKLATWTAEGLRKINKTISPARRFFRIGVAEAIPWSYQSRDPSTGIILLDSNGDPIWEGYCIDFIETLSQKLNFSYQLIPPTSGKFGERDPKTGRWDGIVGDLVSGETDIAVTALKMYSEREEVIDYIAPYFDQTGISIVIRKPVKRSSLFKFMTVLRVEVWLSIIAALVTTAVLLWLMDKYSPHSYRNNKEAYPYPCREFTLRESFWFALTSFTPQGGGEPPKPVSSRILVAAYWLFVVLMLATFTANLAAFLTMERMQSPIQSLEQLGRQSRINYTVVANSDTHQYFINMKFAEDTLYRMWKELVLNVTKDFARYRIWDYPIKEQYNQILYAINGSNPVRDAAEGFRLVDEHENADFAFIHDSSEIKYAVTKNCNFTEVGEVFAAQPYAVAVQQGSQLTDELSYAILVLEKERYFEELKEKYWNHSSANCPPPDGQGGITLESLGGVFIATLCGIGLAMVILSVEIFYYKRKHNSVKSTFLNQKDSKVVPVSEKPLRMIPKKAWQNKEKPVITPPPPFETITFRGRKVPENITLGGSEFRPRAKNLNLKSNDDQKLWTTKSSKEGWDLPPYVD